MVGRLQNSFNRISQRKRWLLSSVFQKRLSQKELGSPFKQSLEYSLNPCPQHCLSNLVTPSNGMLGRSSLEYVPVQHAALSLGAWLNINTVLEAEIFNVTEGTKCIRLKQMNTLYQALGTYSWLCSRFVGSLYLSVEGHSSVCFGGADCGERTLEVEGRISKDYQSQ